MKVTSNRAGRVTRAAINGTRSVLGVSGKEPGYEYRIVNDVGDRVASMQERGYEIVTDQNVKVGDRRVANPVQEGSPVMASVGNGIKGYVMRIKKEWFDEDQATKAQETNALEESIKRDANKDGLVGNIKFS